MWDNIKRLDSQQNENVSKFVFTTPNAVVESVLYKYPTYGERTVICCSTMSGCPVGCTFCFAPGTLIKVNRDQIVQNISVETLKTTDFVYGPSDQFLSIKALYSRNYSGEMIDITLENGEKISVTQDHPMILKDGTVIEAGKITIDMELM